MREVKHNPKLIRNKTWLRQASIVNFQLPVTIRLNPAGAPDSNVFKNNATLDLGPSLGSHVLGLSGSMHATMQFQDAYDGGRPGDAMMSITPSAGGMWSTSVPMLTNPNVTRNPPSPDPMTDGCAAPDGTPIFWKGTADDWSWLHFGLNPDPHGTTTLGAPPLDMTGDMNPGDAVIRTGSLSIGIANPGFVNGAFVGKSGGTANLFGLTGPSGYAVDVKVTMKSNINTIARTVDAASINSPVGNIDCRQVWTGQVPNLLTAHLVGSIRIAPAVTSDHYLRIARVQLASTPGGSDETVTACLVPYWFYTGGPDGPATTPNPPPTAPCGDPNSPLVAAGMLSSMYDGQLSTANGVTTSNSEVQVAANLNVNQLNAEVLLGNVPDPMH